ncbi:glycosyl transferase family group 2-domain-containing protein [Elsinoe ampelina]|uniref:Glycosyl transferase family group 2-domain-containing protein n=1 Tax=Elsinoe ampelina TaxID=302913 RepID=A0A6A6GNB8_9PEZI|nr:glycosyl transferase family group 2-domain-containing protein [Elsinoe ampelina]
MSDIAESVVEDSVAGSDEKEETSENILDELKHEIMVNYLFQQQCARLWIADGTGEVEGVMLKKSRGNYLACPPALADSLFADSCVELNVQCAMTVNSRVIKTFLAWTPDAIDVPLTNGLRVQVLPTMEDLPAAKKHQFAAFVADEALLVVWDDDVHNLIKRAKFIEDELMELVWSSGEEEQVEEEEGAKKGPGVVEARYDPVTGEELPEDRPTNLQNTVLVSFTLVIILGLLGAGFRQVAIEISVDYNWYRLFFFLLTPVQVFFTLFFAQVIVGCTAQIIGPIKQVTSNSRFYSALLPRRITPKDGEPLPHVTIQCPVYKEGLEGVIAPTVKSVKAAMSTYELQGGSCNMLFHDDGLQLIDEEERNARIDFYTDNNIGWTARPKHGSEGFVRKGKFKKASNMNFGMMVSCNVEAKLEKIDRHANWNQNDEAEAYGTALQEVLDEHGRAWADGNIRMGDYIIIIDSDTRVPEDCILDAVSEMERSPFVGIMQFSSGVMQVTWTFFENGITYFTNLIYSAIKYTVANGDVAPFVGHNAILRWQAIQQVSYFDEDGYEKFWAENTVSEDFDMSLRLQCNGYIIRLAAWAGEGFQEGVSLTVYDELARWEKYAYGCNELLFQPLLYWFTQGPLTPLCKEFLFSQIRMTSKITILSYIGTYYAIGAAWILTLVNYFAIGWFNGYLDKYYLDSWNVWFGLVIVFVGLGNVSLAVMRYRIGEATLIGSFLENIKWIPMFVVFLGGLSIHVSQALLSHMFIWEMSWGSTVKEAAFSNALIELQLIWGGYRNTLFISVLCLSCMLILGTASFVPYDWKINSFLAWWPMLSCWMSHLLLPIALNPALMTFSF